MTSETQADHQPHTPLKVLVVGATGGTGLATVKHLLLKGHSVTAFSRHATDKFQTTDTLKPVDGNVMVPSDVEQAIDGQDLVIVILGISENPLRVRLFGAARTPGNVRSKGTQNVVNAMHKQGIKRLIVQSSFGVGESRGLLGLVEKLFFFLLLKPQIDDTEIQEQIVRASDVDWVLAQPVHLVDSDEDTDPYFSTNGKIREWKVSRASVARFMAKAVNSPDLVGKTVAISG